MSRADSKFGGAFGRSRFGGPEPTLVQLSQPSAKLKRLVIDGVILDPSDSDAVDSPESVSAWELVPDSGAAIPASISSIDLNDDGTLEFETSNFTDGESYELRAVGDIRLRDGESIKGISQIFTAVGEQPEVSSVTPIASNGVRVVFSAEMKQDAELIDPANYVFGGASTITPILITVVTPTTVDIQTLEELVSDALYSLTVG